MLSEWYVGKRWLQKADIAEQCRHTRATAKSLEFLCDGKSGQPDIPAVQLLAIGLFFLSPASCVQSVGQLQFPA